VLEGGWERRISQSKVHAGRDFHRLALLWMDFRLAVCHAAAIYVNVLRKSTVPACQNFAAGLGVLDG
jgi:hypothetical protein